MWHVRYHWTWNCFDLCLCIFWTGKWLRNLSITVQKCESGTNPLNIPFYSFLCRFKYLKEQSKLLVKILPVCQIDTKTIIQYTNTLIHWVEMLVWKKILEGSCSYRWCILISLVIKQTLLFTFLFIKITNFESTENYNKGKSKEPTNVFTI